MKLIIDIPEAVKHKVYNYGLSLCPSDKEQLVHAIVNGTPLDGVLQEIRQEILDTKHIMTEGKTVKINNHSTVHDIVNGLNMAIGIVERHIKEIEGCNIS